MTARNAHPPERTVQLDITLSGREYRVACKESERAELQEAVGFLDRRMREIRDSGKVGGADRIAVMAALNIAHELLRTRRESGAHGGANASIAIDETAARRRILAMQSTIDQTLAGFERSS
jgi:cell division protein ZapA